MEKKIVSKNEQGVKIPKTDNRYMLLMVILPFVCALTILLIDPENMRFIAGVLFGGLSTVFIIFDFFGPVKDEPDDMANHWWALIFTFLYPWARAFFVDKKYYYPIIWVVEFAILICVPIIYLRFGVC